MQSPDLTLELRAGKPTASTELRERVLAVAEREALPRRRYSLPPLRKLALVAVPAVLAVAIGGALVHGLATSGSSKEHDRAAPSTRAAGGGSIGSPVTIGSPVIQPRAGARFLTGKGAKRQALVGIPNASTRLQQYGATLRVEVENREALSEATKRAMRVARLLGGYVASVRYSAPAHGRGSAVIVVRVPVDRVQDAVEEYAGLGTILDQHVSILDVTRKVNQETRTIRTLHRKIATIERRLADPSLSAAERARLEALLAYDRARLRRAEQSKALTVRRANFARIALDLRTKPKQAAAPASRFERTMSDAGSVLVRETEILLYALIVAGPLLLLGAAAIGAARLSQRRRDAQLLDRT
jgi:hypothetical protein